MCVQRHHYELHYSKALGGGWNQRKSGDHGAHLGSPFSNTPMPGGLGLLRNRNNCTLHCGQHTQILQEPSSHWVRRREQSADHPC